MIQVSKFEDFCECFVPVLKSCRYAEIVMPCKIPNLELFLEMVNKLRETVMSRSLQ